MLGDANNRIYEYNLSTAWDITTATYTTKFFSISSWELTPTGIYFRNDGLRVYLIGSSSDSVHEFILGTAWDISTLSFSKSKSISTQETSPQSIYFKPDGLKMFILGSIGDDINEYNLSIAWDIDTAVYSKVFSISTLESTPTAIHFNSTGTKMYFCGTLTDAVHEYNLSTPWDISSASYLRNLSVSIESSPQGMYFSTSGSELYILGQGLRAVLQYSLLEPFNLSTTAGYILNTSSISGDVAIIAYLPEVVGSVTMTVSGYSATTENTVTNVIDLPSGYGGGKYISVYLTNVPISTGFNVGFDTNVKVSRFIVGNYWSPKYNIPYGVSVGFDDKTSTERLHGGDLYATNGPRHKTLSFELEYLHESDKFNLYKILKTIGKTGYVFVSAFPEDIDKEREQMYSIYGKFSDLNAIVYSQYTRYTSSVSIEEF
jgi:hypothetical protein